MDKNPYHLLKPLVFNENWKTFEEYLAGEKTRLVTQLCNCNETELKELQGKIKMIEQILRLKESLNTNAGSLR